MSSIVKAKWIMDCVALPKFEVKSDAVENIQQNRSDLQKKKDIEKVEIAKKNDSEALKSANDIMKKVLKNSEEIKLKFKEKGYNEKGYNEGYEKGYKIGLKEGKDNGFNQVVEQSYAGFLAIDNLIEKIKTEQQENYKNQEKDLMVIAFEISKKLINQQIHCDENLIPKMLEEIILDNKEEVKIYLSEYHTIVDYHMGKDVSEKIKKITKNAKVVPVKDDNKILIETKDSVIDMSFPVQFAELEKAIEQGLE